MKNTYTISIRLILLFLLQVSFMAQATEPEKKYLTLTNTLLNKTFFLEEGVYARIKTKGGEKHRGKIEFVDKNTISITSKTIKLSDIDKIQVNTKNRKKAGKTCLIIGATSAIAATAVFATIFQNGGIIPVGIVIIGVPVALAMLPIGAILSGDGRSFTTDNKWIFTIE